MGLASYHINNRPVSWQRESLRGAEQGERLAEQVANYEPVRRLAELRLCSSDWLCCVNGEYSNWTTNLKEGMGEPWAGHKSDSGVWTLLMNESVLVSWLNFGLAPPIGST